MVSEQSVLQFVRGQHAPCQFVLAVRAPFSEGLDDVQAARPRAASCVSLTSVYRPCGRPPARVLSKSAIGVAARANRMRLPTNIDVTELLCLTALVLGFGVVRGIRESHSQERVAPLLKAAYAAMDDGRQPRVNQALFELAAALQRESGDWTGTSYGRWLAFELCLSYGRLGVLASGSSEERRDFALAQPWCRTSEAPDVSDAARLRATLAHIDDGDERGRPAHGNASALKP